MFAQKNGAQFYDRPNSEKNNSNNEKSDAHISMWDAVDVVVHFSHWISLADCLQPFMLLQCKVLFVCQLISNKPCTCHAPDWFQYNDRNRYSLLTFLFNIPSISIDIIAQMPTVRNRNNVLWLPQTLYPMLVLFHKSYIDALYFVEAIYFSGFVLLPLFLLVD